jgi:hypothetical protein
MIYIIYNTHPLGRYVVGAILDRILTFNLIGSTVIFYVAARLYVLPRLAAAKSRRPKAWQDVSGARHS